MFTHSIPHQYLSEGTEDPTVTLGNQYSPNRRSSDALNRKKENYYPGISTEQLPHNVRLQYEKEIHIYQSEIETLKEQLEEDEKEKEAYEEMIMKMKKERAAVSSENMKLSQDNEKHRILIEKLKIDNSSMEMEINRFRSERKAYYNNINNIDALKNDLAQQMAEKNKSIEQLSSQLRKLEKNHFQCKSKLEQYESLLRQSEAEKEQLREELKSTLEKYLSHGNVLAKLEYQLKEVNELNKSMKDRIYDLEDQRKDLMLKLGYDLSNSKENQLSDSNRSTFNTNPRSMLEIQSYMKQIGNLLDMKREQNDQKFKSYDKLKYAISNLESCL